MHQHRAVISQNMYNTAVINEFKRFRTHLFVEHLGWDLNVTDDLETDQFDNDHTVYCMLYRQRQIVGGWRAVRTDRPYLCQVVFPQLAEIRKYPARADIWEISRFGINPDDRYSLKSARYLYSLMFRFAMSRWISALVAVADPGHERLLRKYGIRTLRYGPPKTIGHNRDGNPMVVVAGEIPLAQQKEKHLVQLLKFTDELEIIDETLVFRSERIPA